ncbi:MAG: GNAT family N-acetyltransferase [Candidatus Izemoplasmatales bacterium]
MIAKAKINNLEEIASLARVVTNNIHEQGIDQWSDTYPLYEHFKLDLDKDALYVFITEGKVVASISILPQNDPFYHEITWKKSSSLVVHRLMVDPNYMRMKIGSIMMSFAIQKAKNESYESMKVDTHPDNIRMQNLLKSLGFVEIGYIPGMNRIGFECVFE